MTKKLSLDNALNTGWDNFKEYGIPSLLLWNFIFFFSLITSFLYPSDEVLYIIYNVITVFITVYLSIAIYQVYLKAVHKKNFESSDLIVSPIKIVYILLTGIILAIPVIGLVLASLIPFVIILTIPVGILYLIFISIFLSQSIFLILDKDKGPIESLTGSFELIKGNGFRYFLFLSCLGGINLVGLLCFGVGFLFTGALTEVLKAQLFVNLTK